MPPGGSLAPPLRPPLEKPAVDEDGLKPDAGAQHAPRGARKDAVAGRGNSRILLCRGAYAALPGLGTVLCASCVVLSESSSFASRSFAW